MFFIGIDTGTHTGFAVWDGRKFCEVSTLKIHQAMDRVRYYKGQGEVRVFFEDARKRKWYGNNAQAKKQGAGSVKRDSAIWQEFLSDEGIDFLPVHPLKGMTKMTDMQFKYLTGWKGRTSNHARDAGMLVFGR